MKTKNLKTKLIITAINKYGFANVGVSGQSMSPMIQSGRQVRINRAEYPEIKTSDVVAYKNEQGELTIHQVMFKTNKYLVAAGVNNRFVDLPVLPSQIVGLVETAQVGKMVNLLYDSELNKLKDLCGHKLKVLVLKGSRWQKYVYGYYLSKPTSDIDILINYENVVMIDRVLKILGYKKTEDTSLTQKVYIKKTGRLKLCFDVHTKPIEILGVNNKMEVRINNWIWKTSKKNLDGLHYLYGHDLVIYLSLNFIFHHAGRSLPLLSGLAHILETQKINWERLRSVSRDLGVEGVVTTTLNLAQSVFLVKIQKRNNKWPLWKKLIVKLLVNRKVLFYPCRWGRSSWLDKVNTLNIRALLWLLVNQE